jgi:hypothetical protein
MKNTHYIKKIALLSLAGAAILSFEAGVIFWTATAITAKADHIAEREKETAEQNENRIALVSLSGDYEKFKGYLPRIESAFPKSDAISNMVDEMQRAAAKTGNRLSLAIEGDSLQPSDEAAVSYIRFSANFEGTYDGLRAFLAEMRRMSFIARVDAVSFSASETILGEGKGNLTGRMFFRQ